MRLDRILIFLFAAIVLGLTAQAREYDASRIQMIEAQRRLQNQRNLGEQCNSQDTCSDYVKTLERDENTPRVFGLIEAAAPVCQQIFTDTRTQIASRFSDANDLRQKLAQTYPELGTFVAQQAARCLASPAGDASSRYRVSKFYNNLKRFNEGATRAFEEVGAINALLGQSNADLDCRFAGSSTLPQARTRCSQIKSSCNSNSSQLASYAQLSEQEEPTYKAVTDQLSQVSRKCNGLTEKFRNRTNIVSAEKPTATTCEQVLVIRTFQNQCTNYTWQELQQLNSCSEAITKINIAKSEIEARNPWFRTANYFELRKTKSVSESIRLQVTTNKIELLKKVNQYRDSAVCLMGFNETANCDIEKYRETLAETPDIPESYVKDTKQNGAMLYMRSQSCVEESIENVNGRTNIIKNFARDATLTILTGGLAGYAMGARAAVAVGRTASVAGRAAGAATLLADGYYASQSYRDVVKNCGAQVERLQSLDASSASNVCPTPDSNRAQAEREYSNCAASAALAALDTLPFFPAIPSLKNAITRTRGQAPPTRPPSLPPPSAGDVVPSSVAGADEALRRSVATAQRNKLMNDTVADNLNPSLANAPVVRKIDTKTDPDFEGQSNNGIEILNINGERVFSKVTFSSRDGAGGMPAARIEEEVTYTRLLSDSGMGPTMRGTYLGDDGYYRIATDFIDGAHIHTGFLDNTQNLRAATVDEMEDMAIRLLNSGVDPIDLQFRVNASGRPFIIDPGQFTELEARHLQGRLASIREDFNMIRRARGFPPRPTLSATPTPQPTTRPANP